MKYRAVMSNLDAGRAVRRAVWITAVRKERDFVVRFQLPVSLHKEFGLKDREYHPTIIDRDADDWEVVPESALPDQDVKGQA